MTRPQRILLLNAWHDDNKGDSAIVEGIIRIIRKAVIDRGGDVELTVVGLTEAGALSDTAMRHICQRWPDAVARPNPLPTELRAASESRRIVDIPVWFARLVPSALASLRGAVPAPLRDLIAAADIAVIVGGSNLYVDPSVHPLVSMARLYTVAAPIKAAKDMGRPVLMLGHTLGPFPERRRLSKRLASRMIRRADLAVVREASSVAVAHDLGVADVELAPDMAFAIEPAATDRVGRIVADLPEDPRRTVVIAARRHPALGANADARLMAELVDAVGRLAAGGHCGAVLVVAHTVGPIAIEDDRGISLALVEQLAARYPDLPVQYLREDLAPAELAWLYGQMGAMVAVRLHAAILSAMLGTPTYAIAYFTQKTSGVMSGLGLADCVGDFDTVTATDIVSALTPRIGAQQSRDALAATCRANRTHLEDRCAQWLTRVVDSRTDDRARA